MEVSGKVDVIKSSRPITINQDNHSVTLIPNIPKILIEQPLSSPPVNIPEATRELLQDEEVMYDSEFRFDVSIESENLNFNLLKWSVFEFE